VYLNLSSGDYTIRAGRDDRIFIQWKDSKPSDDRDRGRDVRIDPKSGSANIRTSGSWKNTRVVIEVPRQTDIYLRMRAGDVNISGIQGNKDIGITAGEIDIDVDAMDYSKVRASVKFGDLDARALRISKSGIARSFDWRGSGPYSLRATLFAGELTIR
jgi:hypothetical protein